MIFAKKEIINIFHYVIIPKCECECEFGMQNTAKVTNKKEIWSKMDILGLARTLLYQDFILYAFSIAISNYCLKYISNSHSHSHFQQNLKTKVSIISPSSPLFLRRHVAIPASPRNISCVATQETAALSKGISCLTSQLPGQADSNAGTTIAFRQKMLYLCIVNETH